MPKGFIEEQVQEEKYREPANPSSHEKQVEITHIT